MHAGRRRLSAGRAGHRSHGARARELRDACTAATQMGVGRAAGGMQRATRLAPIFSAPSRRQLAPIMAKYAMLGDSSPDGDVAAACRATTPSRRERLPTARHHDEYFAMNPTATPRHGLWRADIGWLFAIEALSGTARRRREAGAYS